jgi:hypothetical protein
MVNKITFNSRIHMLSWKLLAIFHDPIHDFGLNTGRMSSIVKHIQKVREQLKQHKTDVTKAKEDKKFNPKISIPSGEDGITGYSGSGEWVAVGGAAGQRRFAANRQNDSEYFEERNVARSVESSGERAQEDDAGIANANLMYDEYDSIFLDYITLRSWFNNKTHVSSGSGYDGISAEQNNESLSQLQRYSQFFTSITKLIDLFKLLIVVQVVEKHKTLGKNFRYNNVHKNTVLTAIDDLIFAIADTVPRGQGGTGGKIDSLDEASPTDKMHIGRALFLISVIFNKLSSDKCVLQIDLLNSTTFNNILRVFFSCYFYDEEIFWTTMGKMDHSFEGTLTLVEARAAERKQKLTPSMPSLAPLPDNVFKDFYTKVEKMEEAPDAAPAAGGGRRKRHNSPRSFILKGGASKKLDRWNQTLRTNSSEHQQLDVLLTQWKDIYRPMLVSNVKKINDDDMNQYYLDFTEFYERLKGAKITVVDKEFPIVQFHFSVFYNKMVKDVDYHIAKAETAETRSGRINPKAMVVTSIYEYMNELTIEIDALNAENDNERKKSEAAADDSGGEEGEVDRTVTNRISKLFALKGLQYAKASLARMALMKPKDPSIMRCIGYVDALLAASASATAAPSPNVDGLSDEYVILLKHIYFLGMAYIQSRGVLPNIDAKLLTFWADFISLKHKDRRMLQPTLVGLGQGKEELQDERGKKTKKPYNKKPVKEILRVINNGIPGELKVIFQKFVVCPGSSVADAMGSFGSCAGAKKIAEFFNMLLKLADLSEADFYEVVSKINGTILVEVVNSFNLFFGPTADDEMFIECRVGNIDLNGAPTVLSANNVFKVTLEEIEIIMKSEASVDVSVDQLWRKCEENANFKKILTPTSKKATGDINQEFNSIVKNGGYTQDAANSNDLAQINDCLTLGLAGDRPSGVRMALLSLYADGGGLLPRHVVGYGNINDSLVVMSPPPQAVAQGRGGRIRKTKFYKPKMIKTRKNKSQHYKMMSKRRKYNNKTKNRKQ